MTELSHNTIVAFIEDILNRRGGDSYLGENVTMLAHMLQAADLAENAGADGELICAALLHDIGHYTNEFGDDYLEQGIDNYHQDAGARILEGYFSQRVVDCVKYHVDAKRYLCATDTRYYEQLSDASKLSLKLQGGPMNQEETQTFSTLEYLEDILQVRQWDDRGKDPAKQTPPFSHYRALLENAVQIPSPQIK